MNQTGPKQLLNTLLAVEVGSGRLEGVFLADPELGCMWRAQMVLTEACRSVALEDIYLFEGDLALRPYTRHDTHFETARGSLHGTELLRVLVAPGDVLNDPVTALQRCLRAGFGDGPQEEAGDELPDLNLLADVMLKAMASPPGPAMAAIRAAACLRAATGSRFPAGERLLFTCVDHAFRKQAQPRRMRDDSGDADHLLGRMQADPDGEDHCRSAWRDGPHRPEPDGCGVIPPKSGCVEN